LKRLTFIATAAVGALLLLVAGPAVAAPKEAKKVVVPTTVDLTATKAPDGTVTGTVEITSKDPRCLAPGRVGRGPILGPQVEFGFGPLTKPSNPGSVPLDVTPPAEGFGYREALVAANAPESTGLTFRKSFPGFEKFRVSIFEGGGYHELPDRTVGEADDLAFAVFLYARRIPYELHGKQFVLVCPKKRVSTWLTVSPE
jgi:hypothetical protein